MQIWVDADACPVKDEIERLASRRSVAVTHVCGLNEFHREGESVAIVKVPGGPDAADDWIIEHCQSGDLVITDDVPLARTVLELGAGVISFRGEELHPENIALRVQVRDLLQSVRDQGINIGGPPPMTAKNRRDFTHALGQALDRILTRQSDPKPRDAR